MKPVSLVPPGYSPHGYQLRPSDFRLMASADILFWIDPSLEYFLPKALRGASRVRAVNLLNVPRVERLPLSGGAQSLKFENQKDKNLSYGKKGGGIDPHIWLDPRNAAVLVDRIAQVLAEEDPSHQEHYRENAAAFSKRLQHLESEISSEIAVIRSHPLFIFHDALQYFTHRFGLESVASLVTNPSLPPGVHDIQQARRYIEEHNVQCFFCRSRASLEDSRCLGTRNRCAAPNP